MLDTLLEFLISFRLQQCCEVSYCPYFTNGKSEAWGAHGHMVNECLWIDLKISYNAEYILGYIGLLWGLI